MVLTEAVGRSGVREPGHRAGYNKDGIKSKDPLE